MDVTYRLVVEPEDIPVRGNAQASGDDAYDRQVEDAIIRRLDNGDVWAWACVTVIAECEGFKGYDTLGGCSYADEEDFKRGPYYEDMCEVARANLEADIARTRERLARIGAS